MNYDEFTKLKEKPSGKRVDGVHGPLWFGASSDMAETIAGYSVLDDWMGDEGMDSFEEDFPNKYPAYKLLAIIDFEHAQKKNPDYAFDSYSEWFLVVDTTHPEQRVLLWTGEGAFEELRGSFAEFYEALEDAD